MCGIAGLSLSTKSTLNAGVAAAALLNGIASRGPDATGAAWYRPEDNTVAVTKVAAPVRRFLPAREAHLPAHTAAMLLHTRFATHGSVDVRHNNHPVEHGRIVGIHNGVLRNHEDLFKEAGRTALTEVDSEAIMALLNSDEHPVDLLGALRGDAAIAWLDLREPGTLHLARVTGRPLHIGQTKGGSLFFASTPEAVKDAAKAVKATLVYEEEVPEAKYLKVVNGMIAEYRDITGVVASDAQFRAQYAYTSGHGATGTTTTPAKAAKAAPKAAPKALTAAPAFSDAKVQVKAN